MQKAIFITKFLRILLASGLLIVTIIANAQSVAINNSGTAANSSSMLDVSSTTKGMLLPRMTSSQRSAINTPAEGLIVYDTDTRGFWYYNNNVWNEIPKSAEGGSLTLPFAGSVSFAGKVFSITNTNTSNGATGLHGKTDIGSGVNPAFTMGAWGDNSTGAGVAGTSNSGIGSYGFSFQNYGVYGYTTNASYSGIYGTHAGNGQGVKGEVSGTGAGVNGVSSAVNGIGVKGESTNGGYAVYGKNSTGSGIPVALTVGVWGDNSNGAGVVGTSNNGAGTYGYSVNNNGSYGFTSGIGYAGVYGTRINNGPAVMGDIYAAGYAIYGKSNSISGKAGLFENIHASGTDTVVKFISKGLGVNSYFINDNTNSTGALINGDQFGNGDGIYLTSNKSTVARFYSKAANMDTSVVVKQDGTGIGAQIYLTSASNSNDALNVVTSGTGNAGKFIIGNSSNNNASIYASTSGTGNALWASIGNSLSTTAAIFGASAGSKGVEGLGQQYGVVGSTINAIAGIGVLGQADINDATGIGVKGISYGNSPANGAITGVNMSQGIGVYGNAAGSNGTGVFGTSANGTGIIGQGLVDDSRGIMGYSNGTNGVGIYGLAGANNSLSQAAVFINPNANNYKTVTQIENYGTGKELYIASHSISNNEAVIRLNKKGGGKFLQFDDSGSEIFSVAKSGNLITDGTITVKTDKGIVRSSTATQLVYKVVSADVNSLNMPANTSTIKTVSFSGFSAAPAVSIGNFTYMLGLGLNSLIIYVYDVTSTSCKLYIKNETGLTVTGDFDLNLLMIGAE
jgi:hypothetical protein